MYAIVDIETTGSFSKGDGITEIGAVISDGVKIIDEFHTLVNPETEIPQFITSLTGIDNAMVQEAPKFEEIHETLFSFLEGQIFVAHNVQFDYNFIKAAFEKEGVNYSAKRLCTVRLGRKLIPESKGHSLSKITNFLGIVNNAPHRALGDAMATTHLFHELVKRDQEGVIHSFLKSNSHETILPLQVEKEDFVQLPHLAGVYFFLDSSGKILYIGKAKNLKKRVSSHFSGSPNSRRRHSFHTEISKIDFEVTGSDLLAALREDELIRKHWPKYNKAQKNRTVQFGIIEYVDQNGDIRLGVQKCQSNTPTLEKFYSEWKAKDRLMEVLKMYGLLPELCGLPSFLNSSTKAIHRDGISAYKKELAESSASFIFKIKGRGQKEEGVIFVENNAFKKFGFFSKEFQMSSINDVLDNLEFGTQSPTSNSIVNSYIEQNNPEKIEI